MILEHIGQLDALVCLGKTCSTPRRALTWQPASCRSPRSSIWSWVALPPRSWAPGTGGGPRRPGPPPGRCASPGRGASASACAAETCSPPSERNGKTGQSQHNAEPNFSAAHDLTLRYSHLAEAHVQLFCIFTLYPFMPLSSQIYVEGYAPD